LGETDDVKSNMAGAPLYHITFAYPSGMFEVPLADENVL
jgi:hypothetical protein